MLMTINWREYFLQDKPVELKQSRHDYIVSKITHCTASQAVSWKPINLQRKYFDNFFPFSGSGQEQKKEPLKCYQCNSYEDALCADPFFHDELGQDGKQVAKSGNDFLDECPSDGKDYKFCRKIYQNGQSDHLSLQLLVLWWVWKWI